MITYLSSTIKKVNRSVKYPAAPVSWHCQTGNYTSYFQVTVLQWLLFLNDQRGDWNKIWNEMNPAMGKGRLPSPLSGNTLLFKEYSILMSHWCLNSTWLIVHRSKVVWTVSWPSRKEIWTQICSAAWLSTRAPSAHWMSEYIHCKQMVLNAIKQMTNSYYRH